MRDIVLNDIHTLRPKIIHVGEYTYGAEGIKIIFGEEANLYIGKFCALAYGLSVFLGGNHQIKRTSTYPFGLMHPNIFTNYPLSIKNRTVSLDTLTNGDINIGNDVWIGANVTIMSGVTIGDGAVISAHSIVYNKVKPYSVVGGNPASFWFYRFNDEIVKKLLEIKWWDWTVYDINRILPYLCSENVEGLINFYETKIKK